MENNLEMMLNKFRMFETEEVVKSVHISGSENAKKLVFDAHGYTTKKAKCLCPLQLTGLFSVS